MANQKITDLATAGALSGTELIETVQGGVNKKTTTQDIANLAGSSGHVIEDEGTPLTARTKLNFVGAGVTVTDDSGDDATVVTIPGGGGTWGSITGTLSDQTDLQSELDAKGDSLITRAEKTASYTLAAGDLTSINAGAELIFEMNVASANDFTIPLNATVAFPVGTVIGIRQTGAGQTTVVPTVGVTLNGPNNAYKIAAQNGIAFIEKTATDTWYINGETVI